MHEETTWTVEQCRQKMEEIKKFHIFRSGNYNDPKIKALRQQYWRCADRVKSILGAQPKEPTKPYSAAQIAKLMAEMAKKNNNKRKITSEYPEQNWPIDKLLKRYQEIHNMDILIFTTNTNDKKAHELKKQNDRIARAVQSLTGERPNILLGLSRGQYAGPKKKAAPKKPKLTAEEKRKIAEARKEKARERHQAKKAAEHQKWLEEFNKKYPGE